MKLVLNQLRKAYSAKTAAVDNVSLEVADGQMAVLLGPSGCGKTTLLRLISGLEIPDSGNITLDGHDITDWEPKRRDIAMVFQNYALYPHMSVRGNLEFGLKSRHIVKEERDKSVSWAAEMLGLAELLERQPKQLSGGQRQRVALGRAIVRRPKLYLFDEPLSNLDAELRMRMRGEILSLHRRVRGTSIYVTHDQIEAMSLADIIFIMRHGRLVSSGSPKELYNNPPDLFTAGFLGFPAMNLIEGVVTDNSFVSGSGLRLTLPERMLHKSGAVVFGIRPEDVTISKRGDISGEIISIENLGRQELLLAQVESGDRLKLISDGGYGIGDKIKISFAFERSFLFDKESGKKI
jgi:multiple sugar transport system ATP-binding protein